MKTVAILCANDLSVYHEMEGVEVYNRDRDARIFAGGMPVVAHPPCRLWSAYCAHQAKSEDPIAEKLLGIWCVQQVNRWGGVLEQPAHSRLFSEAEIPLPGAPFGDDSWSMEVSQYWFGDAREKATWLYFSGIDPWRLPQMPFRLKPDGGDRRTWQLMASGQSRSRTPTEMAYWLVECARRAKPAPNSSDLTSKSEP